jgi:hypothetical protein
LAQNLIELSLALVRFAFCILNYLYYQKCFC